MPGKIPARNKRAEGLLLKAPHRVGVGGKIAAVLRQQRARQHHAGNADARSQTFGKGRQIHHRAVRTCHTLQAGQRAGVKAKFRVVVVLQDIAPRAGSCPRQQLGAAGGGHGDAGGEVVAGRQVADAGAALLQRGGGQPVAVNVHRNAGQPAVAQDRLCAGVAGVFDGGKAARKQVRQTPQQVLNARAHHDLVGRAAHPAVARKIPRNLCAQGGIALHFAALQKLRALV